MRSRRVHLLDHGRGRRGARWRRCPSRRREWRRGALGGRRPGGAPWKSGALQRSILQGPFRRRATGTGGLQHLWSMGVLPRRRHGDGAAGRWRWAYRRCAMEMEASSARVEMGTLPVARHGDGPCSASGGGRPPGGEESGAA
jgi:hypothetical protein